MDKVSYRTSFFDFQPWRFVIFAHEQVGGRASVTTVMERMLSCRNTLLPSVRDPSLTQTQFCAPCCSGELMKHYHSAFVTV